MSKTLLSGACILWDDTENKNKVISDSDRCSKQGGMIEWGVLNKNVRMELRPELGESNIWDIEFRVGEELARAKALVQRSLAEAEWTRLYLTIVS